MLAKNKKRGGYRPGAGRKPLGGEPMEKYKVTLDPQTVTRLLQIGDGNLSAGIRKAAEK